MSFMLRVILHQAREKVGWKITENCDDAVKYMYFCWKSRKVRDFFLAWGCTVFCISFRYGGVISY